MREKDLKKNSALPATKRPPKPISGMTKAVRNIKDHKKAVNRSTRK